MAQETLQLIITADNKDALKAIEDLAKSTAGLKTKFVENKGATDQATQSLVNLSRVAQDAPYGFIGIANNLNPLLESFQRLRSSSTSNKEAFQSLLGVMTGPAGIGLALGVISSLFVAFGDKLFANKKAVDEAKKAQEEYAKALEKSKEAAVNQGLKLENLIKLSQNANLTDAERVKALNGVRDILNGVSKGYGDQIKNIDDAKEAVKQYTAALIQQAIVERYRNEIADKSIALAKTQENVTKARAQFLSSMAEAGQAPSSIGSSMEIESASRMDKVTFTAKQLRDLKTQAIVQSNDILSLTNQMNSALDKGAQNPLFLALMTGNGKLAGGGSADKLTEVQKVLNNLKETLNSAQFQLLNGMISEKGAKDSFAVQSLEAIYKAIEKIAGSKTQEAQNALKQLLGSAKELEDKYYSGRPQGDVSDTSPILRDVSFRTTDKYTGGAQKALDPLRTARNEIAINKMIADNDAEGLKKRQKAYENFADTVSGMATNAIVGFFDALRNGQNVLEALGDQFLRLAEDIAAAVIKAAIFKAIMTALNASSGGGAGAVAAAANIGVIPFATGGIVTGPTMGLVGEAGPEAIIPLSKLTGMLTKTFSAGSMSSGRGSGGGHFVLRGQDLLLATNRAQKASNLKGQSISLA
jgi:hypothetical protein